jgi:hypothetical protein
VLREVGVSLATVFANERQMLATQQQEGASLSSMMATLAARRRQDVSMRAWQPRKSAFRRSRGLLRARCFARLALPMARRERRNIRLILIDAQRALSMTQREFGYAVGSSHRSAVRWAAGQATPYEGHLRNLAKLLHPHNRVLAAEVADYIDESLVSLGIEAPPPPPPPPLPPPPPPLPAPPVPAEHLVDLLVLTAVEITGAAPAPTRTLLHAVFKRAGDVGLTVETAEKALRSLITAPAPPSM